MSVSLNFPVPKSPPPPRKDSGDPRVARFRPHQRRPELHPQERWVLFWVALHLCFLPWALGAMPLWSQCVSLGLALVGFGFASRPREYTPAQTGGESLRVRPLQRLWRLPLFWIGLALLLYIAVQGLNPAWIYHANSSYWWIEPANPVRWLPSGMRVPFVTAGPWRALIVFASLWLTLCSVWIGFMRRQTFRLLFTVLVGNGVLLALFGLAQQLTQAKGIFWVVKSSSSSFVASFIYRNHAGAYLNILVALAVGLAWWHFARANRRLEKSSPAGVFTFGAVLIGVMALFTLSRGTAAILLTFSAITGAAFFWHQLRQPAQQRSRAVLLGLLVLLGGFLAVGMYSLKAENLWKRFSTLLVDPVASAKERTLAHSAAAEMFKARPVFGWGAGCFRFGFPEYVRKHPEIYYSGRITRTQRKLWEHAHNDLLEFPIEFGMVGSLLFLSGASWLAWRQVRTRVWSNPLAFPTVFGLGLTVVHAWGDFVFQNPAILLTWAVLSLASIRWAEVDTGS